MICVVWFSILASIGALKELPAHRWQFVPHPHRSWARKYTSWACTWHSDARARGSDTITTAILREGCCGHDIDSFPVFLLSSAQARACIANRTILVSGDSYTIQLFVGLADILTGMPSKTEITGNAVRRAALADAAINLRRVGANVQFVCKEPLECYGMGPSLQACSACMNRLQADVRIVGTTIHLLEHNRATTASSIADAGKTIDRLLWVSGPAYNKDLIPFPYNATMPLSATQRIYTNTLGPDGLLARAERNVSFLDIMGMTRACYVQWKNCSSDGGHNSRFVERMKATILLNILCEPIP